MTSKSVTLSTTLWWMWINSILIWTSVCICVCFTLLTPPLPSPPPPGDYEISVKFNEQHIPDSPFLVPVVAPVDDARRLTVTGLQVRHEDTPPQPACCLAQGQRGSVALTCCWEVWWFDWFGFLIHHMITGITRICNSKTCQSLVF